MKKAMRDGRLRSSGTVAARNESDCHWRPIPFFKSGRTGPLVRRAHDRPLEKLTAEPAKLSYFRNIFFVTTNAVFIEFQKMVTSFLGNLAKHY
jgi:hypothetical protein